MPQELLCLFCVLYFAVPAWRGNHGRAYSLHKREKFSAVVPGVFAIGALSVLALSIVFVFPSRAPITFAF
jgi:hypothetical protein